MNPIRNGLTNNLIHRFYAEHSEGCRIHILKDSVSLDEHPPGAPLREPLPEPGVLASD
jgi:hypothetical protein